MDQGPVDAGPNADSEYGRPQTSHSPQEDRAASRARSAFRSDSLRRQHTNRDTGYSETEREQTRPWHHHPRTDSSESAKSAGDPPLYPRVGATAAELTGDVCVDGDDHMKVRSEKSPVKDQDSRPHRMHKFVLYETAQKYYITGSDITEKYFRLLQIDRTAPPGNIEVFEHETVYDRTQMQTTLDSLFDGAKSLGGMRTKFSFWGLLGFIRFTEAYYMLLITKRKQKAIIGGHYVYEIDGTEVVPLSTGSSSSFLQNRNPEETRFLGILSGLDLTKSFYFSYSYDITHSLQENSIRQRQAINKGLNVAALGYNGMFVWNHHLLRPAVTALRHPYDWCLPIIHGFLRQAPFDVFGRTVYVTIIGRRSRHFAGARFLKRGVNDSGYVANDVETEQIIAEKLTTSFHAPGPRLYSNPTYTSYVHHRGSIPLYWTQEGAGVVPKPGIKVNLADPFYQPAALHFDNLFERYGCPVYVLNLIKSREKTPRESKLLSEFKDCVGYLNQSLPEGKKILYEAFDMSKAAKSRNTDVIGGLEVIAKNILEHTGFFHNGEEAHENPQVQNGIARTNCIDCLDRTNAAQFVIGKHAFTLQLKALGILDSDYILYDSDASDLFTDIFHEHGDHIALQYGGSHLVNTVAGYRKLGAWQNSSRDMIENFKRYYHNSFLDSQRQEAYNLFLGNYIWAAGQPMLWDLATDYYLHHSDPKAWLERHRRSYIDWYTKENLEKRTMPGRIRNSKVEEQLKQEGVKAFDNYWTECYQPSKLSSFEKVYAYRMMVEAQKALPERPYGDTKFNFSPFVVRVDLNKNTESPVKKPQRKGVKIVAPSEASSYPPSPPLSESVPRPHTANAEDITSILRETVYKDIPPTQPQPSAPDPAFKPADKAQMHLWTLNQFHSQSLNPHVSEDEEAEYARYISHPTNIPLVTSNELPSDANIDYLEYVNKAGGHAVEDDDEYEMFAQGMAEDDLNHYWDYLEEKVDPLTVTDDDLPKKRYKAYRQWLRGKSLFKQSKVDPEYTAEGSTVRT